jgi:hypothetical protein
MRVTRTRIAALGLFVLGSILVIYGLHHFQSTPKSRMQKLAEAIEKSSSLNYEEKKLLAGLATNETAWETMLIKDLFGSFPMKRVVWNADIYDGSGKNMKIFILDAFVRPAAESPIPLACVVTDHNYQFKYWESVASWSLGFVDAKLVAPAPKAVILITTKANWFYGTGTYRLEIGSTAIVEMGEPVFEKSDLDRRPSRMVQDPPELEEVLESIRDL